MKGDKVSKTSIFEIVFNLLLRVLEANLDLFFHSHYVNMPNGKTKLPRRNNHFRTKTHQNLVSTRYFLQNNSFCNRISLQSTFKFSALTI